MAISVQPAPLADLPDLLTAKQAAKALGVDRRTVDRWAAQKRIHKIKLTPGRTGAARITKASLVALLVGGAE
jgi:excisionase family DNA binding protein